MNNDDFKSSKLYKIISNNDGSANHTKMNKIGKNLIIISCVMFLFVSGLLALAIIALLNSLTNVWVTCFVIDSVLLTISVRMLVIGIDLLISSYYLKFDKKIVCPKCGVALPNGIDYCNVCGTQILKTKKCSKCGQTNKIRARYCKNCGESFYSNSSMDDFEEKFL